MTHIWSCPSFCLADLSLKSVSTQAKQDEAGRCLFFQTKSHPTFPLAQSPQSNPHKSEAIQTSLFTASLHHHTLPLGHLPRSLAIQIPCHRPPQPSASFTSDINQILEIVTSCESHTPDKVLRRGLKIPVVATALESGHVVLRSSEVRVR